jgi:hypothetical protein
MLCLRTTNLAALRTYFTTKRIGRRGELGPYSRALDRGSLGGVIDGRTREGRFLRHFENALIEHCGGSPSVVQRCLISRAARLALRLEMLDERALTGIREFTPHDSDRYIAWSNCLARTLTRLGLQPAAEASTPPTLDDVIRDLARHTDTED